MSLFQLFIIAAIQGVTEWLPISSSAHVLLLSDTFGAVGRDELLINAVSNLGTLAAMLLYFRKDVASALVGGVELAMVPVTAQDTVLIMVQTVMKALKASGTKVLKTICLSSSRKSVKK